MYLNDEESKLFYEAFKNLKNRMDIIFYLIEFGNVGFAKLQVIKEAAKDLEIINNIVYDNLPAFINSSSNIQQNSTDIIKED